MSLRSASSFFSVGFRMTSCQMRNSDISKAIFRVTQLDLCREIAKKKANFRSTITWVTTNGHIRFVWNSKWLRWADWQLSIVETRRENTKNTFLLPATPSLNSMVHVPMWTQFVDRSSFYVNSLRVELRIFPLEIAKHVARAQRTDGIRQKKAAKQITAEIFQECLAPVNGFNHKCSWWINIVTWRGMAAVECTNHFAFACLESRSQARNASIYAYTFFLTFPSLRSPPFNQWREMIFIFYGKKNRAKNFCLFAEYIFFLSTKANMLCEFSCLRAQIFDRFVLIAVNCFCYRLVWNVPLPGESAIKENRPERSIESTS